jgi:YHS domain-containing protein
MVIDPICRGVIYEPEAAVLSEYAGHSSVCCSPF